MSNFFLLNSAIEVEKFDDFLIGINELSQIQKREKTQFIKHDSIWGIKIMLKLYEQSSQDVQGIMIFLERDFTTVENDILHEEFFDLCFPDEANGFLGINFSGSQIKVERQVIDQATYIDFFENFFWTKVTFKNLWKNKEELFPNLILCGEVEAQIAKIGSSSFFRQIIDRLREFDKAIKKWTSGGFSYKSINENYSLIISPESKQTMDQYGNERRFSLPTGGTEFFELHIKTGELRFHFYPDEDTRDVYVGYIGPHLNTISN